MPRKKKSYYDCVSEKVLQARVVQCAKENGFVLPPVDPESTVKHRRRPFVLAYHTYSSRRSVPGFPDLVMLSPGTGRCIVAELKTETGKLSVEQERWLEAFRKNPGIEVFVWRPSDWPEITRILGGKDSRLFV